MRKSIRERFAEMTRLYHFTTFESACMIIESKRLRFGKLPRMNDLIESNKIVFQRVIFNSLEDDKDNGLFAEEEMRRYQQISFAQDRSVDDKIYEGFNLHTMWGLYADKGYGACLVFDKNKLKLAEGDYARDVEYMDYVLPDYAFRNKSKKGLKSEIWRNRDEIFFCKRKEWEYEQEYRVIRRAKHEWDDEYLDVSDALSFVILCRDESLFDGESIWEGSHYMDIKSIDRKLPVLSYEFGFDWYELWRDVPDDPIWTEMSGFYI
ncbi:DUF2971 domain-containing protein [Prevotella communis]|nr:DUF2971 domain-containing protein [Prevotella communis]UKK56941.1 DUF2971 domain-containing protein [Prevotella communis]